MKKAYVICKNTKIKGIIQFFLVHEQNEYFLFITKFRHSSYDHFKNGVLLNKALDFGKIYNDGAIRNVTRRIYENIPYIEKEYGIKVRKESKKIKVIRHNTYFEEIA